MDFTYKSYEKLIGNIKENDYKFVTYHDWTNVEQCVILRHDIDNDIEKACKLAYLEKDLDVRSTYFVLVSSDFYNVFSTRSERQLKQILECGHEIGLHFDEVRYPEITSPEKAIEKIQSEVELLSEAVGAKVKSVSMHRPSKMILEADLDIPGVVNSYGKTFFKDFKYLSDSRRRWREPIDEIVASREYKRLHILTHAIWYNEIEQDIHDSICAFVNDGNRQRYITEADNITDLEAIMKPYEVL